MTTTRSPAWMEAEPSGMMVLPSRAMAATSIPGLRRRSLRGVSKNLVLGEAVNYTASIAPPRGLYRFSTALPSLRARERT